MYRSSAFPHQRSRKLYLLCLRVKVPTTNIIVVIEILSYIPTCIIF